MQFKDSVHKGIGRYPKNYDQKVKYYDKRPRFVLDKEIIDNLTRSFARIYPLISYEFQIMLKNLSSEIESYKLSIKKLNEKKKEQKKCEHEYGQPVMTIFGFYGRQCIKCNNTKRVKESVYKVVSDLETALNDNFRIEEIQPPDFESNIKPNSVKVTLISPDGEIKTIRGLGEEAYALRDSVKSRT